MPDERERLSQAEDTSTQHWFAGKDVDVLIYKVNRRPPLGGDTLFQQPGDVLAHLEEVLSRATTVETGRQFKREWRLGNKVFDYEAGVLTGMIGWARSGEAISSAWDEGAQAWVDRVVDNDVTAVAPFAFVAAGRFLGVLRHSSFSETTVSAVFTELLNRGERHRLIPTTDWDVEPVGDEEEFYDWLASTDRVLSVDFVFKRPNPDAEREFEDLFRRMDELSARQIRETIVAADNEKGLAKQALRTEPVSRAFITAAMAAFGYVVGRGTTAGKQVRYDQRRQAARERVENVSPSWQGATEEVVGAVRRARMKRQRDG